MSNKGEIIKNVDDEIDKYNDLDNLINTLSLAIDETDLEDYKEELQSLIDKAKTELKNLEKSIEEESIKAKKLDLDERSREYWRSQF